jgi:hypothetical protein
MGRAHDVLIPTRFLLTIGHFVTLVLVFYNSVRRPQLAKGRDVY